MENSTFNIIVLSKDGESYANDIKIERPIIAWLLKNTYYFSAAGEPEDFDTLCDPDYNYGNPLFEEYEGWYNWEKDMKELSEAFPDYIFDVLREGENPLDKDGVFVFNGKFYPWLEIKTRNFDEVFKSNDN